jgi:hypothetical protein
MKIKYISENGKIGAVFSEASDWNLFNRIADFIAEEFNGHWLEKVDGLEQRYWDIGIENAVLTLHLEHYLGISLFPAKENDAEANNLVRKIGDYFETNFQ